MNSQFVPFLQEITSVGDSTPLVPGPGGVLNFGLGRGVPLGFLKCHPSMYPFWRKSDPSMYQKSKFFAEIWAILAQISENFKKLTNQSTKFAPFWRKFKKILKNRPIKVPYFWKKRDPLMYLAAWFCYPCLRHIPITTFVLSTPPGVPGVQGFSSQQLIGLGILKAQETPF